MSERLSQLQDAVNMQAENFCNSVGIIQQFARPSFFPDFEKKSSPTRDSSPGEDYPQMFAQLIARTAKDIDLLIDSLPSEESTPELQASHLRRLEVENQEATQKLEETVERGERLLKNIQKALEDIANAQLYLTALEMPKS
ncbi:mediator complex subunit 21 [Brevipalpus obovatus]|uniref:mediator complex subunit 21 n=1 Tax=Brevipalpus obovatus TaxID=246614 RepID=UPI003D9DB2C0